MKYEFHAGDYVRIGDQSGYVMSYRKTFEGDRFNFHLDDGKEFGWTGPISALPGNITQIGQYHFDPTKGHIQKIERDKYMGVQGSVVLDKIDELIDVVNWMKEKLK